MLVNDEGTNIVTHFGRYEIGVYMTPGIRIVKAFDFQHPTKVRLDYMGEENFFRMTHLGIVHIPTVFGVQHVEEVEELEDEQFQDEVKFKMWKRLVVLESITLRRRLQKHCHLLKCLNFFVYTLDNPLAFIKL